ncbi:major facilitator superfamily domain-containing protein [Lipomyces doorenjongii]|uniref:major facilitator superfamily domain-containing protein n=1 Tax=Lipomyces doorenjongii TaxID=383834 RepID=UPI0034CEB049
MTQNISRHETPVDEELVVRAPLLRESCDNEMIREPHQRRISPAMKFVLMVGLMSFFADFTYEGSRSIIGQYLRQLGSGPLTIGIVTGFGELLGYGLRLFSGRAADRTGMYWPIIICGYTMQMTVVPLLSLAKDWRLVALLSILERVGKATRNPPRDAMLSHAAKQMGYGWTFGVHEALDQFGALCGPLFVALSLTVGHQNYQLAFAALAVPAAIMLSLLTLARTLYPRPRDLDGNLASVQAHSLPRSFWVYLAAAAFVAAGFADFPIIAYQFQVSGTVSVALIPIFYGVASLASGIGSLVFGRMFDRIGIGVLIPLSLGTACYAPLVFFGSFLPSLLGTCLWGLGMGAHESIIPAVVAPMVAPDQRASAYGLFTGVYGVAWFIGSAVIGALLNVSLPAAAIFAVCTELIAIPLILIVRQLTVASTLPIATPI